MRSAICGFMAAVLAVSLSARLAPAAEPLDKAKEEAALQKNAEAFVAAFNKGDANPLAAFLTEDRDLIDQDDRRIKGCKAIKQVSSKVFADAKGAKLFICRGASRGDGSYKLC